MLIDVEICFMLTLHDLQQMYSIVREIGYFVCKARLRVERHNECWKMVKVKLKMVEAVAAELVCKRLWVVMWVNDDTLDAESSTEGDNVVSYASYCNADEIAYCEPSPYDKFGVKRLMFCATNTRERRLKCGVAKYSTSPCKVRWSERYCLVYYDVNALSFDRVRVASMVSSHDVVIVVRIIT